MRNSTLYLSLILCLYLSRMTAQQTFEDKAKDIAVKIDAITKEEKAALKIDVEAVNRQLNSGAITKAEADEKKMKLAEACAKSIETRTTIAEEELNQLVQDRIDGKIKDKDSTETFMYKLDNKNFKRSGGECRTTSQFVIAEGFNNLVTNGAVANSDFGYLRSVFFEWGVTMNTRIFKDNSVFHLKYGVTGVYNIIAPTDNRYFVENGNQTNLETFPVNLKDDRSYFKNVFITVPVHLEFDFSKKEVRDGKTYFKSHQGFRFGIGGFGGYNTNSKQFLAYNMDGHSIKEKQKGNWNISDWNYGLSTYFGYKEISLYLKYDLNPMFEHNVVKQNNISLGIRFDLN